MLTGALNNGAFASEVLNSPVVSAVGLNKDPLEVILKELFSDALEAKVNKFDEAPSLAVLSKTFFGPSLKLLLKTLVADSEGLENEGIGLSDAPKIVDSSGFLKTFSFGLNPEKFEDFLSLWKMFFDDVSLELNKSGFDSFDPVLNGFEKMLSEELLMAEAKIFEDFASVSTNFLVANNGADSPISGTGGMP